MSTIVLSGLDSRTTCDSIESYCQKFGRILNCYIKLNQCTVTFADKQNAEEFVNSSPHRIDSNSSVSATWKITFDRNSSQQNPSINSNSNYRLTIRGTREQLEEKNLIQYFSRFGRIRMCLSNPSENFATITFDDRIGYEKAFQESKHFLNGRSLIVEPYTPAESNKRKKLSDSNESTTITQLEYEKEQLINEQIRLENQHQERIQLYEYEKFQLNEYIKQQQNTFTHQIGHYQYLLKQSLDEILNKDQQIEQLKKENKDIDDLLRQSVHDNEQQQIQIRKREEVHTQTKRKYEELYKAYMKLKDNSTHHTIDKDSMDHNSQTTPKSSITANSKSKSTIDNIRKKL